MVSEFVITWINILIGIGIIGILMILTHYLISKYVVWAEKKEDREEIEKFRSAMRINKKEMDMRR